MPAITFIARSKSSALSRILDNAPRGYHRYTFGVVDSDKAKALAQKLHQRHAVAASVSQRVTRKAHGKANAVLILYWPPEALQVHWLMLFTNGELDTHESLKLVTDKPYLEWLGYELMRYPNRGRVSWTWRRPKAAMEVHYMLLGQQLAKRQHSAIAAHLQRLANQPGFHGVREQSKAMFQYARQHGYTATLPTLFYMQKIPHGDALQLSMSG